MSSAPHPKLNEDKKEHGDSFISYLPCSQTTYRFRRVRAMRSERCGVIARKRNPHRVFFSVPKILYSVFYCQVPMRTANKTLDLNILPFTIQGLPPAPRYDRFAFFWYMSEYSAFALRAYCGLSRFIGRCAFANYNHILSPNSFARNVYANCVQSGKKRDRINGCSPIPCLLSRSAFPNV